MKHIKRLFSTLLVLALALTCALPAFAAEGDVTININDANGDTDSTYKAYQLMTVKVAKDETVEGGFAYAYTVVSEYSEILQEVTGQDSDENVIKYLENLKDADAIRTFANSLYTALQDADKQPTITATENQFTVALGYYLIVEEAVTGTTSLVMLDTAGKEQLGSIDVDTKESKPSVEKKVQDANDSVDGVDADGNWQDSADYDIGDDVPFRLEAKLNGTELDQYETYKLVFHDEQSDGLSFNADSVVVSLVHKNADGTETVKPVTNYVVKTTGLEHPTTCDFEIVIDDVLNLGTDEEGKTISAANDEFIRVTYTSKLTGEAVKYAPEGNPNEVYLTYTNNPYENTEGKTPKDKVTVFTYQVDVSKVGPDGVTPLPGAQFTLSKFVDGEWKEIDTITVDADKTIFHSKGLEGSLDDGRYKIEETVVPDGYNKADDIYFEVKADHDKEADDPTLTNLTFTQYTNEKFEEKAKDKDGREIAPQNVAGTGKFTFTVINNTGARLPSTGGMGTTLFYIVGGILVAAAVILLVTKKRVNSDK